MARRICPWSRSLPAISEKIVDTGEGDGEGWKLKVSGCTLELRARIFGTHVLPCLAVAKSSRAVRAMLCPCDDSKTHQLDKRHIDEKVTASQSAGGLQRSKISSSSRWLLTNWPLEKRRIGKKVTASQYMVNEVLLQ